MSDYCIGAAKKTNSMNMQGYHKKGARKCAGNGVGLRSKGPLGRRSQCSKRQSTGTSAARVIQRRSGGLDANSRVSHCQVVSPEASQDSEIGRAACSLLEKPFKGMQSSAALREYHSIVVLAGTELGHAASSDGALWKCIRDGMRLVAW